MHISLPSYTPQEISNFENTRTREESIEFRLNVVMNKFAEEGINFTVKSIHGEFEFRIGCDYCPSFNINPQSVNSWEANVEQHMAPQTSCTSKKNTKMQRKFVRSG